MSNPKPPVFKEGDLVVLSNLARFHDYIEDYGSAPLTERIIKTCVYEIVDVIDQAHDPGQEDHVYNIRLNRASKRIMKAHGDSEWEAYEFELFEHIDPVTDDELADVMKSLGVTT